MTTPPKKKASFRKKFTLFLISCVVCFLFLEVALRVMFSRVLYHITTEPTEAAFWERSEDFGWQRKPDSKGYYTNGYFNGYVVNDSDGNRLNADESTFREGARNILFIGDSTTASLEVNNDETIPALLESHLRESGDNVNIINLGVRGYGTDQSVLRALHFAEKYQPTDIIYLYYDNDFLNNNVLRQGGRVFGKGVFIKREGEAEFSAYNYPVPDYDKTYWGIVVFDENGHPQIHTGERAPRRTEKKEKTTSGKIKEAIVRVSFTARALRRIKEAFGNPPPEYSDDITLKGLVDKGIDWEGELEFAYLDSGPVRKRREAYFNAQMRHLLGRLREIPSIRRVHVAEFPSYHTQKLLKAGEPSMNADLFNTLKTDGVIESYINLNQIVFDEKVMTFEFQCIGDRHYNAKGNAWITEKLSGAITFRNE